jgi:hypothetical protein
MVPPIAGTEYILVSKRSVQRLLAQCALPVTAQSSIFSLLNLGRLRAALPFAKIPVTPVLTTRLHGGSGIG